MMDRISLYDTCLHHFHSLAFRVAYPNHVMFAFAVAWIFGLPPKDVPLDTLIALLTTATFQGFAKLISDDFGVFMGTVIMTILCIAAANCSVNNPSAFACLASPFFTLTPGSMGMRGLDSLVSGNPIEGCDWMWQLFLNLTLMAIGVIIGGIVAKHGFGWRWHKNKVKKEQCWRLGVFGLLVEESSTQLLGPDLQPV